MDPLQSKFTTNVDNSPQPLEKKVSKRDKILEFFTGKSTTNSPTKATINKVITDKNPQPNSPAGTSNSVARKKILELMSLEIGEEIKIAPRELLDSNKIKQLGEQWDKNLDKIALLKAYVDEREKEINAEGLFCTISHYFAKKMDWSLSNQADQLYKNLYKELTPDQKKEVDQLLKTYVNDMEIVGLGKYEGLLKNDKPYGFGTLKGNDFICKGHFSYKDFEGVKINNDKTTEKGIFTSNIDLVIGIKKDNTHEYKGKYNNEGELIKGTHEIKRSNYKQEGVFIDSKLNGYGKQSVSDNNKHPFDSGTFYEGNFTDGIPNGLGRLVDKNGVILEEGEWKDGLPGNKVSYSLPQVEPLEVESLFPKTKEMINIENLGKYSGSLVSETILIPHGLGRLIRLDGSICYGRFENGNFIEGEYIRKGKPTIKGTFSGNFEYGFLKEGTIKTKEVIYIKNIGKYVGRLNEVGIPHGRGYLKRYDGSSCSGEFSNGNFIKGRFTRVDGTSVYGEFLGTNFENGLMKKGQITTVQGLLLESGSFDDQLRLEGKGLKVINKNITSEGQFKFGKPHGYVQTTSSSTTRGEMLVQEIYELGKQTGNRKATFKIETVSSQDFENESGLVWDFDKINHLENGIYLGDLNEKGEPQGAGTLFNNDGSRCAGQFENGNFIKGKITKYTEELVDGKFKQTSETTEYDKTRHS